MDRVNFDALKIMIKLGTFPSNKGSVLTSMQVSEIRQLLETTHPIGSTHEDRAVRYFDDEIRSREIR